MTSASFGISRKTHPYAYNMGINIGKVAVNWEIYFPQIIVHELL